MKQRLLIIISVLMMLPLCTNAQRVINRTQLKPATSLKLKQANSMQMNHKTTLQKAVARKAAPALYDASNVYGTHILDCQNFSGFTSSTELNIVGAQGIISLLPDDTSSSNNFEYNVIVNGMKELSGKNLYGYYNQDEGLIYIPVQSLGNSITDFGFSEDYGDVIFTSFICRNGEPAYYGFDMILEVKHDGSLDFYQQDMKEYEQQWGESGLTRTGFYIYLLKDGESQGYWQAGYNGQLYRANATMGYRTSGLDLGASEENTWTDVYRRVHVENLGSEAIVHNFMGLCPIHVTMNQDSTCFVPLGTQVGAMNYENYGYMQLVGCQITEDGKVARDYNKQALNGFYHDNGMEFYKLEYREEYNEETGQYETSSYYVLDDPDYFPYCCVATNEDAEGRAYSKGWCYSLSISYDGDINETGNRLYVPNFYITRGGKAAIPVNMRNNENIVAFQFDVELPAELSLSQTTDEFGAAVNDIFFSDRAKSTHIIGSNYQSDGSLRIIGYSSQNAPFDDFDGTLLTIGVEVPEDLNPGDYTVVLKNVRITNSYGQETVLSDGEFVISVAGTRGDANNDEAVTMGDVVAVLNYVLGKTPDEFNVANADVTGDGNITMGDVVGIVNLVLAQTPSESNKILNMPNVTSTVSMTCEDSKMVVALNNVVDYTAFQMDFTLPVGMTVENIAFAGRATNSHILNYKQLPDGRIRVVGWSSRNSALQGNNGELFTISVKDRGIAGTISIDRILFTTTDGTDHKLLSTEYFGDATGISNVCKDETAQPVYDLQGRRVANKEKGLYIINGKKLLVK